MYNVFLINFGSMIYEGLSFEAAKEKVLNAGFEAVIRFNGTTVSYFSPITGWKNY